MVDLHTQTAANGALPIEIGATRLAELQPGAITWVAPFNGQSAAVSEALKQTHGVGLPAAGASLAKGDVRSIWFGPGQALIWGAVAAPAGAAVADQTDGWVSLDLSGAGAGDVMARLCPVDLRAGSFATGRTARTLVGHMTGSLTRTGQDRFLILLFRSMTGTAIHDFARAMRHVAARRG